MQNTSDDGTMSSGYTEDIDKDMDSACMMRRDNTFGNLAECYVSAAGHARLFSATRYGKRYMLKCLKPDFLYVPVYRTALVKEFEIGIQLDHPNICRTVGFEEVDGLGTVIVEEYVDGCTLEELMDNHGLTDDKAMKITSQLMDALEYMHAKHIIHRDLKPSNIMVTAIGGDVKLIDFSLSDSDAFCVLKSPAGTSGYIAPEQLLRGAKSDIRSDIYSLGVVIGQMASLVGNNHLRRMARRCACADVNLRPECISQLRKPASRNGRKRLMVIAMCVLSLVFACLIAVRMHQQTQTAAKEDNAKENEQASSSTNKGGPNGNNEILDIALWPLE